MMNGKSQRMEIGERILLMRNESCYSDVVYAVHLNGEYERMIEIIWMINLGKD